MLVQQALWWLSQLSLCVFFWKSCNVCIICLNDGPSVLETFWTPLSMSFYALTSFWFGIICLSESDFDFAYSGSSWGSVAFLLLLSSCRALSVSQFPSVGLFLSLSVLFTSRISVVFFLSFVPSVVKALTLSMHSWFPWARSYTQVWLSRLKFSQKGLLPWVSVRVQRWVYPGLGSSKSRETKIGAALFMYICVKMMSRQSKLWASAAEARTPGALLFSLFPAKGDHSHQSHFTHCGLVQGAHGTMISR